MARCLIIGCGCRGQRLARELRSAGHAVRGTTRSAERLAAIEASGAEAVLADPDRVATVVKAFDHVAVVCVLLGSAVGPGERVAALHGTRLEMLLTKLVDTTVRGVVYESVGSVDSEVLAGGAERVRDFARRSLAAFALLEADPGLPEAWTTGALQAVNQVIGPPADPAPGPDPSRALPRTRPALRPAIDWENRK